MLGRSPRSGFSGALIGVIFLTAAVATACIPLASSVHGASQSEFSNASSAIASAFVGVQGAQKSGGNVSLLVAKLQSSLNLFEKATAENPTNPGAAAADLQNATAMAQSVSSDAVGVGQAGASAKQIQLFVSIGLTIAILVAAGLVYLYGDRAYHRIWLRLYGRHLVEKVG